MNYIAYYRVSTKKQGESGLGLEAQQAAVIQYTKCEACIIASYTDVESGKKDDRPQLMIAIAHVKQTGARLVIAKLDRLSRNVTFISSLMDAGIGFTCCDMPEANEFTIHIFAALAQQERKLISTRTKAALAALKARGGKLGTPSNLTSKATERSVQVRVEKARENANSLRASGYIRLLYTREGLSYRAIAARLNAEGFKTPLNKSFRPMQVKRLLERSTI